MNNLNIPVGLSLRVGHFYYPFLSLAAKDQDKKNEYCLSFGDDVR